jgi:hypothetical protein
MRKAGAMKITEIAARLRTIAANMEVLAIREGDLDYPDEMLLPFLVNAFADDNVLRFASAVSRFHPETPRE